MLISRMKIRNRSWVPRRVGTAANMLNLVREAKEAKDRARNEGPRSDARVAPRWESSFQFDFERFALTLTHNHDGLMNST